jgi:5-methylcytosine-specific restriction endonuclease McrA
MGKRFCKCGRGIVVDGRCNCCNYSGTYKPRTKTTKQAGRGHDWRTLSERYRAINPLCEDCLGAGRTTAAAEVHHVIPITVAPELRLAIENLVSLCKSCHQNRHADDAAHKFGK